MVLVLYIFFLFYSHRSQVRSNCLYNTCIEFTLQLSKVDLSSRFTHAKAHGVRRDCNALLLSVTGDMRPSQHMEHTAHQAPQCLPHLDLVTTKEIKISDQNIRSDGLRSQQLLPPQCRELSRENGQENNWSGKLWFQRGNFRQQQDVIKIQFNYSIFYR